MIVVISLTLWYSVMVAMVTCGMQYFAMLILVHACTEGWGMHLSYAANEQGSPLLNEGELVAIRCWEW